MEPAEIKKKLESHPEFKAWQKDNPESYLAHMFWMNDEANINIVQVGYCNKDESITTFFIEKDNVKIATEKEAFKKPGDKILSLDASKVKVKREDAMEKAGKLLRETYKTSAMKSFMILQNLKEYGQVYNITFITQSFSTLNVKINSETGEAVKHELASLMDYRRDEPEDKK